MTKRYLGNIITQNPTAPTGNSGANYGVATGVWSLSEARTFSAAGDWPIPASAPGAPTIGTATAGDTIATVAFTANADDGGLDVTSFTATSNPGSITGSASSSPVTVTGLTNGTAYTFTVTATNGAGTSAASAASNSVTPALPQRGVFMGGRSSNSSTAQINVIQYIEIPTTGNASDFGDLTAARSENSGAGSSTRALSAGGDNTSGQYVKNIDYFAMPSTGNASDFGDLAVNMVMGAGASNGTRALFADGVGTGPYDTINYVTIASTGNATDYGDFTSTYTFAGLASTTRALFGGGIDSSYENSIRYYTISSTGNGTDFGDLTIARYDISGLSSATRGVFCGGRQTGNSVSNVMDYVTIASAGNATDFGDFANGDQRESCASTSSSTRGVIAGGTGNVGTQPNNRIDYITIASTGNSSDFGDLNNVASQAAATSNCHGGL